MQWDVKFTALNIRVMFPVARLADGMAGLFPAEARTPTAMEIILCRYRVAGWYRRHEQVNRDNVFLNAKDGYRNWYFNRKFRY